MRALKNLASDDSVVVTQADKGGGVIIMDKGQYEAKMNELLNDTETYEKKPAGYTEKQSKLFNQKARKILKMTERGKKLYHLLEEAPTAPRMRGLPKVHKRGIPMRPITSGIGSAPHGIAKVLAKPLSKSLGSLSPAHIQNTSDMMHRLNEIDGVADKKLASFDVTALFTNVPVEGALSAIKKVVDGLDDAHLPQRSKKARTRPRAWETQREILVERKRPNRYFCIFKYHESENIFLGKCIEHIQRNTR